jgi:hypothetical protein
LDELIAEAEQLSEKITLFEEELARIEEQIANEDDPDVLARLIQRRQELIQDILPEYRRQLRAILIRMVGLNKTIIYLLDKVGISSGNELDFLAEIPSRSELSTLEQTSETDREILSMLRQLEQEMVSISSVVSGGQVSIETFKEASEITDVNVMGVSETELAPDSELTSERILDLLRNIPTIDFGVLEDNLNVE